MPFKSSYWDHLPVELSVQKQISIPKVHRCAQHSTLTHTVLFHDLKTVALIFSVLYIYSSGYSGYGFSSFAYARLYLSLWCSVCLLSAGVLVEIGFWVGDDVGGLKVTRLAFQLVHRAYTQISSSRYRIRSLSFNSGLVQRKKGDSSSSGAQPRKSF